MSSASSSPCRAATPPMSTRGRAVEDERLGGDPAAVSLSRRRGHDLPRRQAKRSRRNVGSRRFESPDRVADPRDEADRRAGLEGHVVRAQVREQIVEGSEQTLRGGVPVSDYIRQAAELLEERRPAAAVIGQVEDHGGAPLLEDAAHGALRLGPGVGAGHHDVAASRDPHPPGSPRDCPARSP
jgi:hypothetical protein